MISVLVTGASGQLGESIRAIKDLYPTLKLVFKTSKELNITKPQEINQVFCSQTFDYCINCAAYTNVEEAEKNQELAYLVNSTGVKFLSETSLRYNTVLIHVSTDYVFDGKKETPYTISDTTNPINVYGASKLEGELAVQNLLKRYFIVRTSWLYSLHGNNFYTTIIKKARRGETLSITNSQKGSPTNAHHLASYILDMIKEKNNDFGIKHYTDGEIHTWYTFAIQILKDNSLLDEVEIQKVQNYRTFARRPKYSVLETHL
ncbi:dTDP-4-dehydrorhamnose reductase [Euzebyella marina]|uniref:dTDP-4-dehydrorhamnose reductase n=1 Tax=Euzebyella marina TaxID=1761453 RepID=A0A3G2L1G0_9FLAO|nr:dTDP-4-dehydrorhamnose reductase [Euzebyella marina]AYN66085.1 dTDP-4-dehydrorhamnose reductase [Euzebyella marina]